MPLSLVYAGLGETSIDIVAIPPLGVEPEATWNYPGSDTFIERGSLEPSKKTLFHDIPQARVFFYTCPKIPDNDSITLQTYGLDFFSQLQSIPEFGKRSLHLAAYSTAGLILKSALVHARQWYRDSYAILNSCCVGIAFFGVPHSGSPYLSDSNYEFPDPATARVLGALHPRLRKKLLRDDYQSLNDLHQKFLGIVPSLPKVWSFIENSRTAIRRIKAKGRSETFIEDYIVPEWSATLSSPAERFGNESVIRVPSDHAKLCRFGDDNRSPYFHKYVRDLRVNANKLNWNSHGIRKLLENRLIVDLQVFYAEDVYPGAQSIKTIPAQTTLERLLTDGSDVCLEQEVDSYLGRVKDEEQKRSNTAAPPVPNLVITTTEGKEIDITNGPEHEVPSEYEVNDLASRFGGPVITVTEPSTVEQKDVSLVRKPTRRKESTSQSSTESFASSINSPNNKTLPFMSAPAPNPNVISERLPDRKEKGGLRQILPGYKFRWIHIPANYMASAPGVLNGIGEERGDSLLARKLLQSDSWSSRQYEALHKFPHGRFMRPGCGHFSTMNTIMGDSGDQLFLYLPYLHWDTYGCLRARNKLVNECMGLNGSRSTGDDILKGTSLENILIRQSVDDPSGSPYHLRRSLDQFGYPTLADTSVRDSDQIIYKWKLRNAMDSTRHRFSHKEAKIREGHLYGMMRDDIEDIKKRREILQARIKANNESVMKSAKVLMVDQLWCWVINSDTIVTFCSPREDSDNEVASNQLELYDSIIEEIRGDPRFAPECSNPFQLVALITLHAVTGLMERSRDKDLEILRIFEQYINILTEKQTRSFKDFRNAHQQLAQNGGITTKPLDNSDDLGTLLELRDIEDELTILDKLFTEQKQVVEDLERICAGIAAEDTSSRATGLAWLSQAQRRLSDYRLQISQMKSSCQATQESYKSLLDMKQKQANADEAWLARRSAEVAASQSRAVMVFTIFTIIFLPLSFFTSLFGMNVREWSDTPSNPPMATVLSFMMIFSIAVIVAALSIAFNASIRSSIAWVFSGGYKELVSYLFEVLWRRHKYNDVDLEQGYDEMSTGMWARKSKVM